MDTIIELLIADEGMRKHPYRDTSEKIGFEGKPGLLTVGIGRNLEDKGLTPEEQLYLLNNDIEEKEAGLRTAFTWYDQLSEVHQDVLTCLCFNLGLYGLKAFVKFLGAMAKGEYDRAATELLNSKWADQVGKAGPSESHPYGQRAWKYAEMIRTNRQPSQWARKGSG